MQFFYLRYMLVTYIRTILLKIVCTCIKLKIVICDRKTKKPIRIKQKGEKKRKRENR